mgnify:CR=1 FL=1
MTSLPPLHKLRLEVCKPCPTGAPVPTEDELRRTLGPLAAAANKDQLYASWAEKTPCSICFQSLAFNPDGTQWVVGTDKGPKAWVVVCSVTEDVPRPHAFHKKCIQVWHRDALLRRENPTCPECRQPIIEIGPPLDDLPPIQTQTLSQQPDLPEEEWARARAFWNSLAVPREPDEERQRALLQEARAIVGTMDQTGDRRSTLTVQSVYQNLLYAERMLSLANGILDLEATAQARRMYINDSGNVSVDPQLYRAIAWIAREGFGDQALGIEVDATDPAEDDEEEDPGAWWNMGTISERELELRNEYVLFFSARDAIDREDVPMMEALLSRGLNTEYRLDPHPSLLGYAVWKNQFDMVLCMLDGQPTALGYHNRARVDYVDRQNWTALMWAVYYAEHTTDPTQQQIRMNVVRLLLSRGANPSGTWVSGNRLPGPLEIATTAAMKALLTSAIPEVEDVGYAGDAGD